eukprot:1137807-Pelagomonas_calceolata.AAC.6
MTAGLKCQPVAALQDSAFGLVSMQMDMKDQEPRLLAKDPALLLRAMEMFSTTLNLSPQECVSFAMRNSSLVAQNITKRDHLGPFTGELRGVKAHVQKRNGNLCLCCVLHMLHKKPLTMMLPLTPDPPRGWNPGSPQHAEQARSNTPMRA